jgi:hypothetical protein
MIFHENDPLPIQRWGVLVGDACHNMRCALNYLLCSLVPPGQIHRRHQFPILDTEHSWRSELGRSGDMMLDYIDLTHVAVIESAQPYQPTGLQRLSTLERFSNADKHRLIHAAVSNLIDAPLCSHRSDRKSATSAIHSPASRCEMARKSPGSRRPRNELRPAA